MHERSRARAATDTCDDRAEQDDKDGTRPGDGEGDEAVMARLHEIGI